MKDSFSFDSASFKETNVLIICAPFLLSNLRSQGCWFFQVSHTPFDNTHLHELTTDTV